MELSNELAFVGKIVFAMILGFVMGIDREVKNRPAGIRTQMLIAGASCAMVLLGLGVMDFYGDSAHPESIRTDPIRIIQAIITGISFVGAGTILRHPDKNDIDGLTTAASLLFTSAVGIMVAQGYYILGTASAFLVLFVMSGMRPVKFWIRSKNE